MKANIFVLLIFTSFSLCFSLTNSVADLFVAIESSTNKQVGFVAKTNYDSVAKVLPSSVVAKYPYNDAAALEADVANGKLLAGFISGDVPTGHFNYFSSRVISAQGMLTLNTPWLLKVLNAAISQVQMLGTPQKIIRNYEGKIFTEMDTCGTTLGAFPWPSVSELNLAAESWWCGNATGSCANGNNQYIRIGTIYSKFSWFYDYTDTVTKPTGFYAEYYDALNAAIITQYASSNFKGFRRIIDKTKTTSTVLMQDLANAATPSVAPFDATDIFFYYTSTFTGKVISKNTTYTGIARTTAFQASCVVLGGDGSFFTRVELNQDSATAVLSPGAIAGIVIGGIIGLVAVVFASIMIMKERAGRPMFMKLNGDEPSETHNYQDSKPFDKNSVIRLQQL